MWVFIIGFLVMYYIDTHASQNVKHTFNLTLFSFAALLMYVLIFKFEGYRILEPIWVVVWNIIKIPFYLIAIIFA